ncbi:probable glutamate receptor isoform X2 [Paramacrobiotus metropolitanus]|nr:probable glutamate receptor isoform X2 [Paramacrobiotus metropolitanus]
MRHFIVHSVEEAGALIKATVLRSPIRESQIIFDMPVGMVNAILRVMLQDDMVRQRHFHFVLASLDYQEIARDILRYSSNSFTALSMLDDSAKITTEDALVRDALGFIQSATPSLGASKRNISLDCAAAPYDTWANGENTIGLLRTHSYNGLTGKLTFNATGNRKGYQFGVMESLHGRNLTKRAVWSDTNGLHLLNNDTGDAKTPLKVVGILTDRFLMINACNSTPDVRTIRLSSSSADAAASDQCYTGFVVDLLHEFEITGNTFKLHHSQGHYYYGNNINGTWTGAVGELLQKNADLIVGDLSVIAERESVLDFTIPFMNDGFIILMQKDAQKTFDIFSFMSPFSARLWVSLLLALIVSFVIVLLVGRLSAMEWQRPSDQPRNGHRRLENQFTPQESLWLMIVTLLQQGPNIAPQSCATKIAVGSWYIWGFIVCATYTANLAAFLTLNRMTSTIQSVDDLVGQDEVRYGILEANMASTNFFRNSKEPIYERMWNTMQRRDTLVDSVKTGLERVRQGKFAFIGPKTVVDFADQGQPCDTRIVGQPLYYANYAVAVFSGSPLRKTFSEAILKLNENGVLKTLEKKWFSRDECTSGDGNSGAGNLIPLNPNEVSGLFLILAIGLTVSVAVALGEYFRIGRRRFRKYGVTFNEILLTARKPTDQSATENQSEMNLTSMDASSSQNSWLELKLPGTVAARDRH